MSYDPQGATFSLAGELQGSQALRVIGGAAKRVHERSFCENALLMFVCVRQLRQDAASATTFFAALGAFHRLHIRPRHGLSFPQLFPLISQRVAFRV